jgi:hypothetical protein
MKTNHNPANVRTSLLVPGLALASLFLSGCGSDKASASYKVLKNRAESKLVDLAGKGEVALQMHRDRHAELKTSHIRMVAYEKTLNRKAAELRTRIDQTSDPASRAELERLVSVYESSLPKIKESQAKGVAALKRSVENYERLKVKIEVLNAQIDVNRTLASTAADFDVDSSSREIDGLIASLEQDLDLAEASFEVESMGLDLR